MPFDVQNSWNYWKNRLSILQAYFFRGTLRAETFAIKGYCRIYFCNWGMKKDVFCGINFCHVGMLWKKCRICFCDPNVLIKFFQPSLKKKERYNMGIINMCTLLRNLLCKNIYTMSLFMWSNELFSILKWWLYLYCIFYLVFEHMKSVTQKI